MAKEVVPSFDLKALPPLKEPEPLEPGIAQGVHMEMAQEDAEWVKKKIEQWFAKRDDIVLVDEGISEKREVSFLILEWEEVEIDPIFLDVLDAEDEVISDYSLYSRTVEV